MQDCDVTFCVCVCARNWNLDEFRIPPPISSTKSQPVPPCTNLFFVQPYLGIQKHIHSGPWLCSEMMLPCILGLGCNFVEAPFVWAGFWFCNGSRVQTHFVENTGCWFVLLVLPPTKSGSHYKIRTPLQNQDPEPFFESQQQDQKSPNWVSTKWSSITQAQKFITFRLLFSNHVPDFVEQFRVPAWWSGALSDGLWFKKKGWPPDFVESWLVVNFAGIWFRREV